MSFLDRALRMGEAKKFKQYEQRVSRINGFEAELEHYTDAELRDSADELRERARGGESLDDLMYECFALVREAGRRTMGMRHFDVQLIGGMVLHDGAIAEMRTGEGKTLTATLAVVLNSLGGRGVHLVTVNDYLARRDAMWMKPIYDMLGVTVGVLQNMQPYEEKRAAYAADVTYGTNSEFGFDYLRDNMAKTLEEKVQHGGREKPEEGKSPYHTYAIVDEVDNILIDEARTPLIISGAPEQAADLYKQFARLAPQMQSGKTPEGMDPRTKKEFVADFDFEFEEKHKTISVTEQGVAKAERFLGIDHLYRAENGHLVNHLQQALKAESLYKRDVDYAVIDGEVKIIDEFTGRILEGRRWSEGLHQAVEAKEGVAVQEESQTLATITLQNYFRMYDKLAGMTGTAETEETEFFQIYGLEVVVIPTNRPVRRVDKHDLIYKTRREKYNAIMDEVERQHKRGLPVLVGTVSVDVSETLSRMLKRRGFRHEVLNAKYHQREAEIVAQAGQPGAITIATNMAGRGTDIKLGPGVKKCQVCGITAHEAPFGQQIERPDLPAEEIKRLGCNDDPPCGLVIVGTERHQARRIDRQLRGRAGRQGDPGQSVFFLSLEDDLMRLFGSDRIARIMDRTGSEENEVITHPWVTAAIGQAQKRVELQNFQSRKKLLEYDDVMNQQREVIYALRLFALEGGEELKAEALRMVEQAVAQLADELIGDTKDAYQWDRDLMETEFLLKFLVSVPGVTDPARIRSRDELVQAAQRAAREAFQAKLDHFKEIEAKVGAVNIGGQALSHVMLGVIDEKWKDHLYDLDQLKAAIHYRQWGQKDPLIEYKREGYEMFVGLMRDVHATFAERWLKLQIEIGPPPQRGAPSGPGGRPPASPASGPGAGLVKGPSPRRPTPMVASKPAVDGLVSGDPAVASQPSPVGAGVAPNPYAGIGRNDPCPCGSGKKFKKCHGAGL